jgi:threo-3-hydroxy-L-aspartate ammonia-lyase
MANDTVTFSDVQSAAERLRGQAHRTPVVTSRTFDQVAGCSVLFKCENLQRGGAFKFRGAYNALSQLTSEQRQRGVVAFSSGNHAQGLALAARVLDTPATVVMPSDAPQIKVEATRGYGADIVLYDRLTGDREAIARQLASERGLTVIPPFDHPHIIAGQGTAALELFQDVPDLDVLITPVGGGGLISGCATAAKTMRPGVRVIGVETEPANDAWQSLRMGKRVTIAPPDTIADGIRTTSLGVITFEIMQKLVDEIVLVTDADVIEAMRFMLLRMKLLAEPTGAVPIAALMARKVVGVEGKRVGVIVSGGNADPAMLLRILDF